MGFTYRSKTYWKCDDQCKTLHRNNLEKAVTKKPLKLKGSPRVLEICFFIKTTFFQDDLVNYFFENQGEQTCQTTKHFNKEDPEKIFGNNKTTFISRKILHKSNMKILH